jgi:hypothetical protein
MLESERCLIPQQYFHVSFLQLMGLIQLISLVKGFKLANKAHRLTKDETSPPPRKDKHE